MKKYINLMCAVLLGGLLMGCEGFLDERPDKSIIIPLTLDDYQALMDNPDVMQFTPGLPVVGTDDMIMSDEGFALIRNEPERNAYLWQKEIFNVERSFDWDRMYEKVFIANVVLEGLESYNPSNPKEQERMEEIKGAAFFFRAEAHFHLLQTFAPPYAKESSGTLLGLPYRKNTDLQEKVSRPPLEESYQEVIFDLKAALPLVKAHEVIIKTRPSLLAVQALLARVYLIMHDYQKANEFAEAVLASPVHSFIDYNEVNSVLIYPFVQYNEEVIYHAEPMNLSMLTANPRNFINPEIYEGYDDNDLRKSLFGRFRNGNYNFRGQYSGLFTLFSGLALDEIAFIRAECLVRLGEEARGMDLINDLLALRFVEETYVPFESVDKDEILRFIIDEKRRSMLYRGVNWMDLRRLNQDERFSRTQVREMDGIEYRLEPKSPRYTIPIPMNEVINSGLIQNVRD